jgi:hypothetical protein
MSVHGRFCCKSIFRVKHESFKDCGPKVTASSPARTREVFAGGDMADKSQYSIVTYERRPGYWRAAITPIRRSGTVIHSKTITSIVTPDDFESEPDAQFAAEKIIRKL